LIVGITVSSVEEAIVDVAADVGRIPTVDDAVKEGWMADLVN
jgi:hypothetical protein